MSRQKSLQKKQLYISTNQAKGTKTKHGVKNSKQKLSPLHNHPKGIGLEKEFIRE
jgi:hypothetical protein